MPDFNKFEVERSFVIVVYLGWLGGISVISEGCARSRVTPY